MCVGGKYSYNVRVVLKITWIDHFTIRLYSTVQEDKAINHLEIYFETLNVSMTKEIHEIPKYFEEFFLCLGNIRTSQLMSHYCWNHSLWNDPRRRLREHSGSSRWFDLISVYHQVMPNPTLRSPVLPQF